MLRTECAKRTGHGASGAKNGGRNCRRSTESPLPRACQMRIWRDQTASGSVGAWRWVNWPMARPARVWVFTWVPVQRWWLGGLGYSVCEFNAVFDGPACNFRRMVPRKTGEAQASFRRWRWCGACRFGCWSIKLEANQPLRAAEHYPVIISAGGLVAPGLQGYVPVRFFV